MNVGVKFDGEWVSNSMTDPPERDRTNSVQGISEAGTDREDRMPVLAVDEADDTQKPLSIAAKPAKSARRHAPRPANSEVELKLLASPAQSAALEGAPVVTAYARNKGTIRRLKAIYFDTPDYDLYRAGITLRVCRSGRHFVQTVKTRASGNGSPLRRGEWECPVHGMIPEPDALATLLPPGLFEHFGHTPLLPVVTIEFRRHRRTLVLPEGVVELVFDQGQLKAGDKTGQISEIELELRRGDPAAIYDFALRLNELEALRPSIWSKAERGFALVLDTPPAVQKAAKLRPAPNVSLDDAFAGILQANLHHLFANQAVAEDGRNAEGVHQVRVALRRLRSALAILRKLSPSPTLDGFRADAKWLASSLNDARNWDVFLLDTLPKIVGACPAIAGFGILQNSAERFRTSAYDTARSTLAQPRSCHFQIALGAWIEHRGWRHDVPAAELTALAEPASLFAARILTRLHRKAIKQGRHFKALKPEERHQLRLRLKKLRYAADFFLPLFDNQKAAQRYARRLARLQEYLGAYNDMATTADLMTMLERDAMPSATERSLGAIAGWLARDQAGLEVDLQTIWRAFRKSSRPWPNPGEQNEQKQAQAG